MTTANPYHRWRLHLQSSLPTQKAASQGAKDCTSEATSSSQEIAADLPAAIKCVISQLRQVLGAPLCQASTISSAEAESRQHMSFPIEARTDTVSSSFKDDEPLMSLLLTSPSPWSSNSNSPFSAEKVTPTGFVGNRIARIGTADSGINSNYHQLLQDKKETTVSPRAGRRQDEFLHNNNVDDSPDFMNSLYHIGVSPSRFLTKKQDQYCSTPDEFSITSASPVTSNSFNVLIPLHSMSEVPDGYYNSSEVRQHFRGSLPPSFASLDAEMGVIDDSSLQCSARLVAAMEDLVENMCMWRQIRDQQRQSSSPLLLSPSHPEEVIALKSFPAELRSVGSQFAEPRVEPGEQKRGEHLTSSEESLFRAVNLAPQILVCLSGSSVAENAKTYPMNVEEKLSHTTAIIDSRSIKNDDQLMPQPISQSQENDDALIFTCGSLKQLVALSCQGCSRTRANSVRRASYLIGIAIAWFFKAVRNSLSDVTEHVLDTITTPRKRLAAATSENQLGLGLRAVRFQPSDTMSFESLDMTPCVSTVEPTQFMLPPFPLSSDDTLAPMVEVSESPLLAVISNIVHPTTNIQSNDALHTALNVVFGECGLVILVAGAAGCGKSTLSCLLANRLGIGTVLSTDTVRHILRSLYAKSANPLLYASTYETGKYIIQEQLEQDHRLDGLDIRDEDDRRSLLGYLAQADMIHDRLEFIIEQILSSGESVIVEGVHLTVDFINRIAMKFPGRCVPFVVFISQEAMHIERFANRSHNFDTDPSKNKYVHHLKSIRAIQAFLKARAAEQKTEDFNRRQNSTQILAESNKDELVFSEAKQSDTYFGGDKLQHQRQCQEPISVVLVNNTLISSALHLMQSTVVRNVFTAQDEEECR